VTPLCQRGEASCGACCGLYNRADHSRRAVEGLLERRTLALRAAEPTEKGFAAAAAALEAGDPGGPLFPLVRVCPLLGWLDAGRTRLGCLAHPEATGGPDLRAAGAYDAATCQGFFCPSHGFFSGEEADLVAALCGPDPYLYGLTVTDVPFVRALLGAVAALTGARVELRHLEAPRFREALRELMALKEELAPGSDGLYGAFRPGPRGEDVEREIDYLSMGRRRSPYDQILLSVGADPRSGNDLDALEEEVRRRLDRCLVAFPG